jgi:hypothetical protein
MSIFNNILKTYNKYHDTTSSIYGAATFVGIWSLYLANRFDECLCFGESEIYEDNIKNKSNLYIFSNICHCCIYQCKEYFTTCIFSFVGTIAATIFGPVCFPMYLLINGLKYFHIKSNLKHSKSSKNSIYPLKMTQSLENIIHQYESLNKQIIKKYNRKIDLDEINKRLHDLNNSNEDTQITRDELILLRKASLYYTNQLQYDNKSKSEGDIFLSTSYINDDEEEHILQNTQDDGQDIII